MKTEQSTEWNRLHQVGHLALIGFILLAAGLAVGAENLSTWQKRMPIAFSGYTPPGGGETLTNFPVLVVLSNTATGSGLAYSDFLSPPYGDLRFAAADKTTSLDFEVESWNTNGLSYVWVRVPELTTNTTIYALWGRGSVSASPCTTNGAVWTNTHLGVWHLNGNEKDATSRIKHGVNYGSTNATGIAAGGYGFNGSSAYVDLPATLKGMGVSDVFSIRFWFRALTTTGGMLMEDGPSYTTDSIYLGVTPSANQIYARLNTVNNDMIAVGTVGTNWHKVDFVYDGASVRLFVDAAQKWSTTISGSVREGSSHLQLGRRPGGSMYFNGLMDEVRIESVSRSTNWIWASYMIMASNDAFNAYGEPESQGLASVLNAGGATNITSISAWLNGTLSSTGTSDTAVFAYWGLTDGGTNASAWANTNIWAAPQAPGNFTIQATGLSADSTYYYRFAATNAAGWAWAAESSVFITGEVWIKNMADASENGPIPGTFTVHRAAATTNTALIVNYTVGGTATPGVDYTALSGTVTIPKGEQTAMIEVLPIFDHLVEGPEKVVVILVPGPYMIGTASSATVEIADHGQVTRTWGGGGATVFASNPTNWVGGNAPITGDAIVLDDGTNKNMTWDLNLPVQSWTQEGYVGTVTMQTVYPGQGAFTNFTILGDCVISNGMWTHPVNPGTVTNRNNELYRLRVTVHGGMTIGPNGVIDVQGRGYFGGKGPGAGWSGSHGGGLSYGSIIAPVNLGSGGNLTSGGGAVLLTVGGMLSHNGMVNANGQNEPTYRTGAGGSVYVVAGQLSGTGTFKADGGNVGANSVGTGGRVALVVTNSGADFSAFGGTNTAVGGKVNATVGNAAGTVYRETPADKSGKGHLIVDSKGYAAGTLLNGLEAVTCEFSRITLTNNAALTLGVNNTLIITNTALDISPVNGGFVLTGGNLVTTDAFAWSNYFIRIAASGSTFNPATSLAVGTNAAFLVDKPYAMTCDVSIEAGGLLSHTVNPAANTESYKLDLTLTGSLTMQPGGHVDASAKGFPVGYGPGTAASQYTGASHGGYGSGGLSCYGSIVAPTNLGSGSRAWTGGIGGGAIRLAVSGTVSNGGAIRANAANVGYRTGSGGSIWIVAGQLTGAGPIEANSANNVGGDNPGGGGRIALAVTNAGETTTGYAGSITAYGGRKPAATSGGAGTIYLRDYGQGLYEGTLIVDNDNLIGLSTEISSNVMDTTVANVLIKRKGYLLLAANQTLTVSGIWSNSATFAGVTDSAVIFSGGVGSTSTVYGATTFKGLTCTDAGHTLAFASESTNAVAAYGRLILRGDTATHLILRSTIPGTAWHLNVDALVEQDIEFVDTANSDAADGAEIIAKNSVGEDQDNVHWKFVNVTPGQTIIWTGSDNTLWGGVDNWDRPRTPVETDVIVIPRGCSNYPVFDAPRTVNRIEIQAGGSVFLNGYDLTVTHVATIAGLLAASASETITFQSDVDFTGGMFDSALSSVVLAGGTTQLANLGGRTFYKVRVDNSADILTFSGGFTATELRCEAPSGARSLRFAHGEIVALRDLVLRGASPAATNIMLRSSIPGQKWKLAVSGYRSVRGVDVQDSDASAGLTIPARDTADGDRNDNWTFGMAPAMWTPTSGNNFHTAANWTPVAIPGATTRVLVESGAAMTMTGMASVLDFTVGGGTGAVSVTVNGLLTVVEDLFVLSNGTLAINQPCVVSNGLYVLAGGKLTHSANPSGSNELYRIDLSVHGNAGIDPDGSVDVTGKGFVARWWPCGQQAGNIAGGSYGGRASGPCYGSIVAPTNLGAGGRDTSGGGAIVVKVFGTIRQDGSILAEGAHGGTWVGAGGSIFLTAGALIGNGVISANGGNSGNYPGGGGRVALVVTSPSVDFSGFTGTAKARSGLVTPGTSANWMGAGTVYRQTASDGSRRGTVLIDNQNLASTGNTDVPPSAPNVPDEANRANVHIANAVRFRLTDDFTVGDIWLDTPNAVLDLGSNTLTVNARKHALGLGSVVNEGTIVWTGLPPGVLIIVK